MSRYHHSLYDWHIVLIFWFLQMSLIGASRKVPLRLKILDRLGIILLVMTTISTLRHLIAILVMQLLSIRNGYHQCQLEVASGMLLKITQIWNSISMTVENMIPPCSSARDYTMSEDSVFCLQLWSYTSLISKCFENMNCFNNGIHTGQGKGIWRIDHDRQNRISHSILKVAWKPLTPIYSMKE